MKEHSEPSVTMTAPADLMPGLLLLFQYGVDFEARTGCSLGWFLCHQMKLDSDYVAQHIQTVFLDGRPVDDLEASSVKDGSILALSSAMPGLAGATMRRGGYYSSLRSSISHHEEPEILTPKDALIKVKLFNLVALQLGPTLLKKGIVVRGNVMEDFLDMRTAAFRARLKLIGPAGETGDGNDLKRMNLHGRRVFLSLEDQDDQIGL